MVLNSLQQRWVQAPRMHVDLQMISKTREHLQGHPWDLSEQVWAHANHVKHACSKPSHRQGAINVDSARPNDMQFVQPFACSVPRSVGQNWRSGLMHAKPCGPECHECFMHVAGVHITCFSLPFLALPECETFLAYIIFQIPVITYIYIYIYIYINACHLSRAKGGTLVPQSRPPIWHLHHDSLPFPFWLSSSALPFLPSPLLWPLWSLHFQEASSSLHELAKTHMHGKHGGLRARLGTNQVQVHLAVSFGHFNESCQEHIFAFPGKWLW